MSTAITSRVGRKPITIPNGVNINVEGHDIAVKGPKGHLVLPVHPYLAIDIEKDQLKISRNTNKRYIRKGSGRRLLNAVPGTVRAKIQNAIIGVTQGFERKLVLVGVGYRAQMKGKTLSLALGYSHPIDFVAPEGITIEAPTLTEVIVKGIDKHLVGHTAAIIREFRGPEPYKGKGIRYFNENIIRKETKKK